jgi:hypothetical protein
MNPQLLAFLRENGLFVALLLGLVGAFVFLRTRATDLESVAELDSTIGAGQPVIVEFYSNT